MNSSFARLVAVLVMATLGFLALPDRSLAQSSDEVLRRLEAKIDTMSKEINTLSKENATLRGRVGNIESSRQVATTANTSTGPRNDPARSAIPASAVVVDQAAYSARAAAYPVKGVPYVDSTINWTGCYLGVHGGGGVLNDSYAGRNGYGLLAGGQAGCNYQYTRLVFGIEGEASWSGLSNDNRVSGVGFTTDTTTRNRWDADVAFRIGIITSDRVLPYAKIGGAWGGFNYSTTGPGAFFQQGSATLPGLLIGGGVEYAFSPNWTGKVEYNSIFVRDNVNFTVCGPGACAVTSTQSAAKQTVKVGINYMFH
jgi:outer membrane immunogenic protein